MAKKSLVTVYGDYTDKALRSLRHGIVKACASDRAMTTAQREAAQDFGSLLIYFGVDEFPDWKTHGQALETVLSNRGLPFTRLKF
ncbi:hypothetical protein [Rhodoferax sp.]|uniref:hypothetical protein n=1 Tax=Rhodoferax sp. TaxID=50421 RepID=UPI002ACD2674|nr:hypothetical protein [Rhodoferax sp.]MDZ7920660.1 hypothetical protein [Rhodoferax sp.]